MDVKAAMDELFATPPEDFVAARNALVKALKADEKPSHARVVAELRRPHRLVWAVNQLGLTQHPAVDDLLDAAEDVRGGGGGDMKAAMAAFREAVNAAATAAAARFDPARVSDRADIAQALLALVADEDALDQLAQGRLEDLTPTDALMGLGPSPAPSAPKAKPRPKPAAKPKAAAEPPIDQLAVRRATKKQKEAAKADDSAQRALARAERALANDQVALTEADEALAGAKENLAAAEAAVEAAHKALTKAEQEAAKAVDAQERSAAALGDAKAKAEATATHLATATAELDELQP